MYPGSAERSISFAACLNLSCSCINSTFDVSTKVMYKVWVAVEDTGVDYFGSNRIARVCMTMVLNA